MSKGREMLKRVDAMKSVRQNWEPFYRNVVDYVRINKNSIDSFTHPGQDKGFNQHDPTGPNSARNLALAFANNLTPKSSIWSAWKIPEGSQFSQFKDQDFAQQLLNDIITTQFFALAASNFYNVINEIYLDYVSFHTAALFSEEKQGNGFGFQGMNYRALPINSYVFAENHEGQVDTLARDFELTARQAEQRYGDKVPAKVRKAIVSKKLDQPFEFCRFVGPREDFDESKMNKENMPFAVFDILKETGEIVDEGGYQDFPFHVGRYDKASGEQRGRGPTDIAMGTILRINQLRKWESQGLGKAINPPILAQERGFVGTVRMKQNSIVYARDISQVRLMPTEFRMDLSTLKGDQLEQAIKDIYLTDQIVLPNKDMTAQEAAILREQFFGILGPTVERFQSEVLAPKLSRQMRVMFRRGDMPEIPEELEGLDELDIEFIGPLSRGQKMQEVRSATNWIGTALEMSTQDPSILDNVDLDEFIRWSGPIQGVPKQLQKGLDEVQRIRDQREKDRQKQEQIDLAAQAAESGGKVAPLVRELNQEAA